LPVEVELVHLRGPEHVLRVHLHTRGERLAQCDGMRGVLYATRLRANMLHACTSTEGMQWVRYMSSQSTGAAVAELVPAAMRSCLARRGGIFVWNVVHVKSDPCVELCGGTGRI
jgi:hypothetical protein